MHLNQAIDHYLDAVHYVGKYYPWLPAATMWMPFIFLLLRQGNQIENAYPETISHAKYLFGEEDINRLLKQQEHEMHMNRDLRLDIEAVFKVVASELNYMLDRTLKAEDKLPRVNEMGRLIMAFKDVFGIMYVHDGSLFDNDHALEHLRQCQAAYGADSSNWFNK